MISWSQTATPRELDAEQLWRTLDALVTRVLTEAEVNPATELAGIWKQENREQALLNLAAFHAKYQKRYPEAVRSLLEDEEHLLTFYAFPPVMHRYIRSTNAIESLFSNVRQRTDRSTLSRRKPAV